ncbi:MAG: hypothetical protein AAF806_09400, partial [Bacteroidota bacterium]
MKLLVTLCSVFLTLSFIVNLHGQIDRLAVKIDSLESKIDSLNDMLKTKTNPFKVAIGASFDFIDGSSTTDLYYDVNFFIPSIWEDDKKLFWKKLGLDASFYQTRLFGDSTIIRLPQAPRAFQDFNEDTLRAESYTLLRNRKTTLKNTGIYISPTFELKKYLHAILYVEGLIQEEVVTFNDEFTDIDSTLLIPKNIYVEPDSPLRDIEEGISTGITNNSYQLLLGTGLLLDLDYKDDIIFRLKPVIGYTQLKGMSVPLARRLLPHHWSTDISVERS